MFELIQYASESIVLFIQHKQIMKLLELFQTETTGNIIEECCAERAKGEILQKHTVQ